MKIIYAPEYDGEKQLALTAERPCLLNVIYVGNMGLLSQLELRLGISCDTPAEIEREALFARVLRKQKENMFYRTATTNELGTAHQLLQWRDALLMSGWNPKTEQPSEKLSAMADLEKEFNGKGVADRWLETMHFATGMEYNLTELELKVETAARHLPLVIRKTLEGLSAHGAKVTFCDHWNGLGRKDSDLNQLQTYLCDGKWPKFKKDGSLRVLHFNTLNDAYEWLVCLPQQPGRVAINEDDETLNHILASWNLPLVHAECHEGNPQIAQLFKLGLSLFERPLNIYNLLSYLQIPLHPIPFRLRRKLVDVISDEGGIGEKWRQTIEEFIFAEEKTEADKLRQKKAIFWEMVEKSAAELHLQDMVAYNHAMADWAQAMLHLADEEQRPDAATTHQLHALCHFCSAFNLLVDGEETMDPQKLSELVRSVYRPTNYVTSEAQQYGTTILPDIDRLTGGAEHLIWLDCVNKSTAADPFDFLTLKERDLLNCMGVDVPTYPTMLQEQREAMIRSLCRVENSLTVVTVDYEGNSLTHEHPFVAELKMLAGDAFAMETTETQPKMQQEKALDKRTPELTYRVPEMEVPVRKQSNTSLTQLIHFPFNYVTEYIARLQEPKVSELKDIKTTKGLVAHHFVDCLVKEAKLRTEKNGGSTREEMRRLFEGHYRDRVETAISEAGALLLLQENQIEKKTFIVQLEKSVGALLDILEYLQLEPVDCEVEIDQKDFFDYGSLGGSIDCLLKNAEGKYVIFDFKWTENRNRYQRLIGQGTAMQLELYRWAVEQAYGPVAGMGYYLFPLCQLLTADFADSDTVKHIDTSQAPAKPFMERMHKSIAFRRGQLKAGIVEEAEDACFTDIDYAQQMNDLQMLPLEVKYADREAKEMAKMHKASPYVNHSVGRKFEKLDTNEIPTTHSVLKARLK